MRFSLLSGQHDPKELAKHRDHRCRKNEEEIAKSLEGDYRNELLFTLRQTVELYDLYTAHIPHPQLSHKLSPSRDLSKNTYLVKVFSVAARGSLRPLIMKK